MSCQFGTDAGGGGSTLTFNAGADDNRYIACNVDAAVSDSGTGNVDAATTKVY
jgi:hypothetical protein